MARKKQAKPVAPAAPVDPATENSPPQQKLPNLGTCIDHLLTQFSRAATAGNVTDELRGLSEAQRQILASVLEWLNPTTSAEGEVTEPEEVSSLRPQTPALKLAKAAYRVLDKNNRNLFLEWARRRRDPRWTLKKSKTYHIGKGVVRLTALGDEMYEMSYNDRDVDRDTLLALASRYINRPVEAADVEWDSVQQKTNSSLEEYG